jgi:hypothetical protein
MSLVTATSTDGRTRTRRATCNSVSQHYQTTRLLATTTAICTHISIDPPTSSPPALIMPKRVGLH